LSDLVNKNIIIDIFQILRYANSNKLLFADSDGLFMIIFNIIHAFSIWWISNEKQVIGEDYDNLSKKKVSASI